MQNPDSGHAERLDLAAGAKRPPHGGGFEASWKLSRTVLAENGRSPERALPSEAGPIIRIMSLFSCPMVLTHSFERQ
jgi:hypothetical protein